ncbi:hypothetical protein GCM10010341_90410 [Streptomyces noursei]|nr:hypothetical protein GCM10010341_90410 [Streptomyces noursei]
MSSEAAWPRRLRASGPGSCTRGARQTFNECAACWHTSKGTLAQLDEWKQRHPKARPNRRSRQNCSEADLAEYRQICSNITPRGDVWRAAVLRGFSTVRRLQTTAGVQDR